MTGKRKVALVHRYFWPQNYPYASMLKDIVESLVVSGVEVSVYTSLSEAKGEKTRRGSWGEKLSVNVNSIGLSSERGASVLKKAINAIWFGLWGTYKLLSNKHDIVMVATTPPVVIAFLVSVLGKIKGFRVVYHCQDIHPESLYVNNSLRSKLVYKLLIWMDSWTVRHAWQVVVLSSDMKKTIVDRGLNGVNVKVVNNFIFEDFSNCESLKGSEKTRFLFAGSLGRFQNLEILMQGIAKFSDRDDLEFLFLGDGPMKAKIQDYCDSIGFKNVNFISQVPIQKALGYMCQSDIGFVSLSAGIIKVAYPSKSIMYMSTGLPILAILDTCSELSGELEKNNLGISVEPNIIDIERGIEEALAKLKSKEFNRDEIRTYANETFSKEVILKKLTHIILSEL
jgi:glycosyltransferase involved in cell wall biosynthesis